MAESREAYRQNSHSAFVVGYTGEVGKELVRELARDKIFSRLVLIGRRKVEFEDQELYKDVEQQVVDFNKLEEYKEVFKGLEVGFCCLGTTRKKAGAEGFYQVDHDYVMATANLAKEGGTKDFHLVSSTGANKDSWFLYPKTKGQVEEELKGLEFERLNIYRPGFLLCDRAEPRTGETALKVLLKPVISLSPTSMSIPTSTVAKGMINQAVSPVQPDKKWEIFDNKAIHQLSGELKQKEAKK